MKRVRAALARLAGMFAGPRADAELREELEAHLEMATAENIRRGMRPEEARRQAILESGGLTQAAEAVRAQRGLPVLENFAADVRYAVRALRGSPGFAATATITLALGIGANTAVFSVVNALLLRPPAHVAEPDRLATIYTSDGSGPLYGASSYADVQDFGAGAAAFSGIAAYGMTTVVLSEPESGRAADMALIQTVTANYFDVLGVPMALGRSFGPDESRPGGSATVILGSTIWRRRYGADPAIVGRTIRLGGAPLTVIGVAPAGFDGLLPVVSPAFYIPIETSGQLAGVDLVSRGDRGLLVVGRLAEEASLDQGRAQLAAVAADLFGRFPDSWDDVTRQPRRVTVLGAGRSFVPPQLKGTATAFAAVLMAVVAALLLICCANIANLLLLRATVREREVGVRVALGASRGRLLAQLVTESMVLAVGGAALGVTLAYVGTRALARVQLPLPVDIQLNVTPDPTVLAFAVGVSVAAALAFGLAPALMVTRRSVTASIRAESSSTRFAGAKLGLRGVLAGGQITVAVVLLVMAGLLLRSLSVAQALDPGFRTTDMLFVDLVQDGRTTSAEQRLAFHRALRERTLGLQGVRAVSYTTGLPLSGGGNRRSFGIQDYAPGPQEDMEINTTSAGPGYLDAMGVALQAGRDFTEADGPGAPGVAIVNEAFVRRYLGGTDALGKRLSSGRAGDMEIVGVARDAKYRSLAEEPLPFVYLPADQNPSPELTLIVHAPGGASRVAEDVRGLIAQVAPDVAVTRVATPDQHLILALLPQRAGATMLGLFGAIGLALASLGIYGVMAYAARRRAHEIAVRMTLGARSTDIVRMVLRQGMVVAVVGGVLGLVIAAGLTQLVDFLLFGVEPLDPIAFAGAAAVVAAVTVVANWLPARRSASLSPRTVLQGD
jgi:predicted permease